MENPELDSPLTQDEYGEPIVPTDQPEGEQADQSSLSMIEQLLGETDSNPDQTTVKGETEVSNPAKDDNKGEKEKPETETTSAEPILIDDELIEKYPVLRAFRGKDLREDLPKSYDSLVRKMNEQAREISKLNNQVKEVTKGKSEIEEEEAFPDPIDDPAGYAKWLRGYVSKKQAEPESQKQQDNEQTAIQAAEANAKAMLGAIQVQLPKDVTAEAAIQQYVKENAELFYDEFGQPNTKTIAYFDENPKLFIHNVLLHQKAKEKDSQLKETQKTISKKVYESTKKNFQEAQRTQPTGSQFQAASRQEPNFTDEEKLFADILNNNKSLPE